MGVVSKINRLAMVVVVSCCAAAFSDSPKEVIYSFPMDEDPGWQTDGQWGFGQPQGIGGDPSSGFTGTNVYGYNLAGVYSVVEQQWLTTTALDCSGYTNVTLQFQRWLGAFVIPADLIDVEASTNGVDWVSVWKHTGGPIEDTTWLPTSYNISAVADNQSAVYLRWGLGRTQAIPPFFPAYGWNIDDVEILGIPVTAGSTYVIIPDNMTEGDGVLSEVGKVGVSIAPATNLTVALSLSEGNEVSVPESVVIPAGKTNALFTITVVDDELLDGSQSVTLTATAPDYQDGTAVAKVHDNETASLDLSLPQTSLEGAGIVTGAVVVSQAPDKDVVVELVSNNPDEVGSSTAVIPAGQSFVNVTLQVFDDSKIDGIQTATVEARVENWQGSQASVFVVDNEDSGITLSLPADVNESDGVRTNAGTISLSGSVSSDVHVLLTCSDSSELQLPAFVTIPAGKSSVLFDVEVVDDHDMDGLQQVSVIAQAPGYIPDAGTINISDNDVHHLAVAVASGDHDVLTPVEVRVSAVTIDQMVVSDYTGQVNLSAAGDGGTVPVEPAVITNFISGSAVNSITFGRVENNVVLEADAGAGMQGESTAFNVLGPVATVEPVDLSGVQVVSGGSVTRTITISNAGNTDLEFDIKGIERPDPSLVLHYTFDNDSGTVVSDDSGNDYHGTLHGATLTEDRFGNPDSAYHFDGLDDYILGSDVLDRMDSSWSYSLWMRTFSYSQLATLIAKGLTTYATPEYSGYTLRMLGDRPANELDFLLIDDSNTRGHATYSLNQLPVNEYVFVTCVYERPTSLMSLYVNGDLVSSNVVSVGGSDSDLPFAIGALYRGSVASTSHFSGDIDDVRIYSRALSAEEVVELATAGDDVEHHVNLIENGDFEQGNIGFTSGYTYSEDSRAVRGVYYVGSDANAWAGSPLADHTSGSGNVLMANSSSVANTSTWQQEVTVVAGESYACSAWHAGLDGTFLATLDFRINGASIGSASAEYLVWNEFSAEWTATSSGNVILSIVDTQLRPPFLPVGNAFAIDDISFTAQGNGSGSGGGTNSLSNGLVASYSFSGSADDESGNGHDGVALNGAVFTNDVSGRACVYFDGINDYVRVPGHSDLGVTDFTLSAWVKPQNNNNTEINYAVVGTVLPEPRTGVQMALVDLKLQGMFRKGGEAPTHSSTTDEAISGGYDNWSFVTVSSWRTNDQQIVELYVDGVLQKTEAFSSIAPGYDNQDLLIGMNGYTPSAGNGWSKQREFEGFMDDVRIFNRALSADEVMQLYAGETGQPATSATVLAVQDAYITEHDGYGGKTNPRGTNEYLVVVHALSGLHRTYPMVKFDLTRFAGRTIDGPTVDLVMDIRSGWGGNHVTQSISVRELLVDWNESTVTWANLGGGGFSLSTQSGATLVTRDVTYTGETEPVIFTLPSEVVQGWIDDPASNHGLILVSHTTSQLTDMSFWSKESGNAPRLLLELEGDNGNSTGLSIDKTAGTVAPGSNVAISVTFDASGLPAGTYTNVMLTINSNDPLSPSNTIPVSIWVAPAAPVMVEEPETTDGSSNEVAWDAQEGPVFYWVEVATSTNATAFDHSGWIGTTRHVFNNLDSSVYYYRAKASVDTAIGMLESAWSDWVWSEQVISQAVVADEITLQGEWALSFFGDDDADPLLDADGDGQNNLSEYITGTDPTNALSYFVVDSVGTASGNAFVLTWESVAGRVYSVLWKECISDDFQALETEIRYPQNSYTDTVHGVESCGFYQVEAELD